MIGGRLLVKDLVIFLMQTPNWENPAKHLMKNSSYFSFELLDAAYFLLRFEVQDDLRGDGEYCRL